MSAKDQEDETPWARTQGTWVHRWLSVLADAGSVARSLPCPLRRNCGNACGRRRRPFADARESPPRNLRAQPCRRRELPDWWQSTWQQARSGAALLVDSVAAVQGQTHGATEWTHRGHRAARWRAARSISAAASICCSAPLASLEDVWLVDYKTGNRQPPLKKGPRRRAKASNSRSTPSPCAPRARGRSASACSRRARRSTEPQIHLADLDGLAGLWRILLRMQETGVFGMLGPLRAEFGYGQDYPLATLAIDEDILADKWLLTHPDLAPEEDES